MGRVFASSDWHAQLKLGKKVLNWLQPDDILYFIGDAVDRGPHGLELFNILIDDPRVHFLCGNHEDMMVEEINHRRKPSRWEIFDDSENLTVNQLLKFPKFIQDHYINMISKLPKQLIYYSVKRSHTVILEHAGHSLIASCRPHDPLWDRSHFHDNWVEDDFFTKEDPNTIYLVHGHTPVQFLKYEFGYKDQPPKTKEDIKEAHNWLYGDDTLCSKPTIIRYCDGHKFDIDLCTAVSNRIALLDLDTFEEIYFD